MEANASQYVDDPNEVVHTLYGEVPSTDQINPFTLKGANADGNKSADAAALSHRA